MPNNIEAARNFPGAGRPLSSPREYRRLNKGSSTSQQPAIPINRYRMAALGRRSEPSARGVTQSEGE